MDLTTAIWKNPAEYVAANRPELPVHFFSPAKLQITARQFKKSFPGLVTYAVKANPDTAVIENLVNAGITSFDVASPMEMDIVRAACPRAVMHYNNPVRSVTEIRYANARSVKSYSVDCISEFEKLHAHIDPHGVEASVRIKLALKGGHYDFGDKFGAILSQAHPLLQMISKSGFRPSITFHVGTQCHSASAWHEYIMAAASVAKQADVEIYRLNVGGGFPSHRSEKAPDLSSTFSSIDRSVQQAFRQNRPTILCEPGRAMVAESMAVLTQVKAKRGERDVFLNDGIYGSFAEMPVIDATDRLSAMTNTGAPHNGPTKPRRIFGPTCDSLDVMPQLHDLPVDLKEGDYLLFQGMGAYSKTLSTGFNGYGVAKTVTASKLDV